MAGLGAADAIDTGLQISEQILKLSMRYLVGVKDAREDIKRVRNEVLSLQDNLVDLKDLADDPDPAALSSLGLLNQPDGALQQCQELLKQLAAGLELGQDEDEMKRFGLRALKWPLSTKAVERALKVLRDYQDKFGLAVNRDHLRLSREIKNTVTHVDKRVVAMQTQQETLLSSEYRRQIDKWLSAPDPSSNHNAAREKRQGHTGAWFTEGSQYASWKVNPTSFLWLHGIPGNGKSVLCSTIIEDITQHCHPKPDNVVIYFYFDFNDKEKQGHHGLMRSLVKQLSMQLPSTSPAIKVILSHCQGQQPTTEVLLSIFRQMLDEFRQTFVVIDALDECTDREKLMDLLTSVLVWRYENLRLLVTSRREKDIEDALAPLSQGCQTDLRNASVDDDIRAYIQERLRKDARLSKQVEVVRNEIQTVLMDGAHGMFRWVVCQLDALRKCRKPNDIRRTLTSLPKTLDDTYTRILANIDENDCQDALIIFQWLVHSARPLRVEEMGDVLAVDRKNTPRFEPENRISEPEDLLSICSSLITTSTVTVYSLNGRRTQGEVFRFAHFSVQEFLTSDRIRDGPALAYHIDKGAAEGQIASSCLAYLLYFKGSNLLTETNLNEFPLAQYAAKYWGRHARAAGNDTSAILVHQLGMVLFSDSEAFLSCNRLHDPHLEESLSKTIRKGLEEICSPLFYASAKGLIELTRRLLEAGADVDMQGGIYGPALYGAALGGHKMIVQQLLEAGADVNIQGGLFNTALQMASASGHQMIIQQLLEARADINLQGGINGTALQAASFGGHQTTVQQLLEAGADVNIQGGDFSTALQAASAQGHQMIVQQLLEARADVNIQGGEWGSALQVASAQGYQTIVQQLLKAKADVNIQRGVDGTALQAASTFGYQNIVQQLLETGADVNMKEGPYGSALQAASSFGHQMIVQQLLEAGADVNTKEGHYGSALQAALTWGHQTIVQQLLEAGADVNIQGGLYGTVLQAASVVGHQTLVQQLLQAGAEVNIQGGPYGSALQAARKENHDAIAQLLRNAGAVDLEADVEAVAAMSSEPKFLPSCSPSPPPSSAS